MSLEQSGGVVAAKRAMASDAGGEDLLSALPDDILVLILLRLDTWLAARTSILSRRWRRVWTFLPVLRFSVVRHPHCLRSALSASEVPLRRLFVRDHEASSRSLAEWLPAAARRVSGELYLSVPAEMEASQSGTLELPCFEKATSICLDLGFIGISVPPSGVFSQLTRLNLSCFRFHGPSDLGDIVSSPRCPCLQKLTIHGVRGLDGITINSESLQLLELQHLRGVRQVTVVAPVLNDLSMLGCFIIDQNQPVANISAPQLTWLKWVDSYDPSSVHLSIGEHLQLLGTFFFVYGRDSFTLNRACLMLLPRFKAIENLVLSLAYDPELDLMLYLMEDMIVLPSVTSLHLRVVTNGHAFGACIFHVLRICSGIKQLELLLSSGDLEEQTVCSPDCICDQPTNWKTEELSLNHLQDLEIQELGASEHEIAFVKQLLMWVPALKMMTVTFNYSISENKAKELFQLFRSFSRTGLCMKFYIYQEFRKVFYAPED